jgi:hypothetical protein
MDAEVRDETKLREMLATLFEFKHELEVAEIRGDALTADTARSLIRAQRAIIQRHRRASELHGSRTSPRKD